MSLRSKVCLASALSLVTLASSASAIPVDQFLTRANVLEAKGFTALFSSDLKRLRDQAIADLMQLRSERVAAQAARRPAAFCPPTGGIRMTDKDLVAAMQAVPPPQRAATDTKDALRAYLARRFPCPTGH